MKRLTVRLTAIAARARAFRRPSTDTLSDVAFLAGLGAIAAGCGWIFPPAAPIVGGAFLAAVGWTAARGDRVEPVETRVVERWHSVDEDDD